MAMPVPEDQQCGTPVPPRAKNLLDGLGMILENTKDIRKHALNKRSLLQWLAPDKVGVVSNKSLKLNAAVLEIILHHWCPLAPDRKTEPVGWLKLEITNFKEAINLPDNVSQTYCEAHAIRAFISRLIRMHDGSKKRDSVIRRLIGILSQYFSARPRSRNSATGSGEDSEGAEGEGDHGDDGNDGGGDDPSASCAAEHPKEVENEEVVETHGENDDDESLEPPGDLYPEDEVHMDKLAYHMGGTPRPTPRIGSPWWSPESLDGSKKDLDSKPEPTSVADVELALKKLEQSMAERRVSLLGQHMSRSWSKGDLGGGRDSDPTVPFNATQVCEALQAEAATPESWACNDGMDATRHYSPMPCKSLPNREVYQSQILNAQPALGVSSHEGKDSVMDEKEKVEKPTTSPTLALLDEEVDVDRVQQLQVASELKGEEPETEGEENAEETGEGKPKRKRGKGKGKGLKKPAAWFKSRAGETETSPKNKKQPKKSKAIETDSPKGQKTKPKAKAKALSKKSQDKEKTPKPEETSKSNKKRKSETRGESQTPQNKGKVSKEQKSPGKKKVKATFARRVVPKFDPSRTFYISIRAAFEKEVQGKVRNPSSLEDPFFKFCSTRWDYDAPESTLGELAVSWAKAFLECKEAKERLLATSP